MAKLSALEAFNEVSRNIGESTVTDIAALSGLQLVIWNKIIESIQEISTDQNTRLSFLEALGTATMTSGYNQYPVPSDMQVEDIESFRQPDSGYNIKYMTPQEWDEEYPKGIDSSRVGYPTRYTKFAGNIVFNNQAGGNEDGKEVRFRYWRTPTYYSTATATSTCDIPEPFDRTCLVAMATLKVLDYLGSDEAEKYRLQVYGGLTTRGQYVEGSLDKLRDIYSSPRLKPRMSYIF